MTKSEYKKVLEVKKATKKALYQKSYPDASTDIPLLLIMGPSKQKEDKMLLELLEGLKVLPIKVIIVDDNIPADTTAHPTGQVFWVNSAEGRNKTDIEKYLEAADMVLCFDEDHEDLNKYMESGAVIIGHEISPMLENYHPNDETGNAFTFDAYNPWEIFRAIVRASETYRFPFDWENIVRGVFKK